MALAALPKKNSTYAGKVAGKTVTLKVGNTVTKGRVVVDCGASGRKQPAFSVKIKSTGAFSGHGLTAGPGIPPAQSLKGRFSSSSKTTATLSLVVCDGNGGKVTLKRK